MLVRNQLEILQQMQKQGFNICNCGNCGGTILFNKESKEVMEQTSSGEGLVCPHCKEEMAYSDCPDLYYEGSPDLEEILTEQEKDLQDFLKDIIDHYKVEIELRGQGDRSTISEGKKNICMVTRATKMLSGVELKIRSAFGGISEEFYDKMVNEFNL